MVGRVTGDNVFQVRLNELFAAPDRRLTNAAVAKGLLARRCRISTPYLSQLRTGVRTSPSDEVVAAALADYFEVPPGYFFTIPWSGDRVRVQGEDAAVVDRLDDVVLKELLAAANGLSAASLGLLADIATKLRISDHCPPVPADAPSYARLTEAALGPRRTTVHT